MRRLMATSFMFLVAVEGSASEPVISAEVLVTANGRELFENWAANAAGGFTISPVKIAKRGEFLSAVILFKACAPDSNGNCKSVLDITAFDPNGGIYGEFKGQELWVGKTAPAPGQSQLAVGYMGLVIEPSDPEGKYRVVATARDLISGKSAVSEASFSVEPSSE